MEEALICDVGSDERDAARYKFEQIRAIRGFVQILISKIETELSKPTPTVACAAYGPKGSPEANFVSEPEPPPEHVPIHNRTSGSTGIVYDAIDNHPFKDDTMIKPEEVQERFIVREEFSVSEPQPFVTIKADGEAYNSFNALNEDGSIKQPLEGAADDLPDGF